MKRTFQLIIISFLGLIVFQPKPAYASIVETNTTYSYETMKEDLQQLEKKYGDLMETYTIGQSVYGRDLILVRLGNGQANTFYNGSHHGREWITTTLNMKMIEAYAEAAHTKNALKGYDVHNLLQQSTLWFMPMVNPDGVTLQQQGLNAFPKDIHSSLRSMNNGSSNFDRWKANIQGIDLNRQYPSGWDTVRNASPSPSWKNYKGKYPFQAPESKVMRDITYLLEPDVSLAYHSSGRVLYWNFNVDAEDLSRDRRIAETYASLSGYRMVSTHSGAGYTDWINTEFDRPSLTPELSAYAGETHVDPRTFPETWERNEEAGLAMAEEAIAIHSPKQDASQSTVLADKKTEAAITPPEDEDKLYEKALQVSDDYGLSLENGVELYSWYQQCGQDCSVEDSQLDQVFTELIRFEAFSSPEDVSRDKVWTVELNTEMNSNSVQKENVFIQREDGRNVAVSSVKVEGKKIIITPYPNSYYPGQTYTLYLKDLQSKSGKVMKEPVKMTFTIQ